MAIIGSAVSSCTHARAQCDEAAHRLYDAEVALHHARQSGVDSWVRAANEQLHAAVVTYVDARHLLESRDESSAVA